MNRTQFQKLEVAQILEDFIDGKGHPLAWDAFTLGSQFDDVRLEEIRLECAALTEKFPPDLPNEYCNEQGRDVIRRYIFELRNA